MAYRQNYKEKQELMKNTVQAAGLVSERYSGVSSIVFRMTYYQSTLNRILMTRTLSFFPANYACFHIDCMRDECTDGGFDLGPIVADMVKTRKRSSRGKIYCHGKKEPFGHASISYEVKIEYRPV